MHKDVKLKSRIIIKKNLNTGSVRTTSSQSRYLSTWLLYASAGMIMAAMVTKKVIKRVPAKKASKTASLRRISMFL